MATPAPAPVVAEIVTAIQPEIHKADPISGFVKIFGVSVNPWLAVLMAVILIIVFVLWKAQRDGSRNSFNVWDLIMDRMPDNTRKTSVVKTTFAAAFLLSSFVIIDQEIKNTLESTVFGLYLATFCAPIITKMIKGDVPLVPTTIGGSA